MDQLSWVWGSPAAPPETFSRSASDTAPLSGAAAGFPPFFACSAMSAFSSPPRAASSCAVNVAGKPAEMRMSAPDTCGIPAAPGSPGSRRRTPSSAGGRRETAAVPPFRASQQIAEDMRRNLQHAGRRAVHPLHAEVAVAPGREHSQRGPAGAAVRGQAPVRLQPRTLPVLFPLLSIFSRFM